MADSSRAYWLLQTVSARGLAEWCLKLIDIFGTKGVPEEVVEMQREVVKNAKSSAVLQDVAAELAEGFVYLPPLERSEANLHLIRKHGLGYEILIEKKLKRLRALLRTGKISSDDEFRESSALAGDMEIGIEVRRQVNKLLLDYDSKHSKSLTKSSVTKLKKRRP